MQGAGSSAGSGSNTLYFKDTAIEPQGLTVQQRPYETLGNTENATRKFSTVPVLFKKAARSQERAQFAPTQVLTRRAVRFFLLAIFIVIAAALPSAARKKETVAYGEGLIINVPSPAAEVERVVADIAADGIIRGTREYNKDEFVNKAQPASSCSVFPDWKDGGKVFYKVRTEALDPRGFKDSNDIGTLAVRYVVMPQGAENTVLRIDALFKEDFKRTVHLSDGSVENSEYRDIQDHLDFFELMKKEDAEAVRKRRPGMTKTQNPAGSAMEDAESSSSSRNVLSADVPNAQGSKPAPAGAPRDIPAAAAANTTSTAVPAAPVSSSPQVANHLPSVRDSSGSSGPAASGPPDPGNQAGSGPQDTLSLEQRVKALQGQVECVVKPPGAPLKSAPFHTAMNLQSLPTGTEVLILITTPYWYGVETHDGQHGWVSRDEVKQR